MKITQVLNFSEIIHTGMDIKEAIKSYSIYYGITDQYSEPAILKVDNGKYYKLFPQIVVKELSDEEIKTELLNKSSDEKLICGHCHEK